MHRRRLLATVTLLSVLAGVGFLARSQEAVQKPVPLPAVVAADATLLALADGAAEEGAKEPAEPKAAEGDKKPSRRAGAGQNQQNQGAKASVPPASAAEAGVPVLSSGDSYDDFPSIAQGPDGALYAAYAAYYDNYDQIRLHKQLANGKWSTATRVPLVEGRADIWMPQLAVDAKNRPWVIWSEQTGAAKTESGNWDLYARAVEDDRWGPIIRLTENARPDINPHVAVDSKHNIYVVWQAHPQNNGDIMLCRFDGEKWSKPLAVTSGPESDWYPQVAIDRQGVAWVVFDSYRNGDYDVFLARVEGDKPGEPIAIADSKFYEAHPTVACGADGKVWIAWEQGGYNWGKDQGHWLKLEKTDNGTPLGSNRAVKVVAYQDGVIKQAPDIAATQPDDGPKFSAMAALAVDNEGRVWLRFRRNNRGVLKNKNQFSRFWTENITSLTSDGWTPAANLAGSTGRISVFSRILPAADGGLLVAYNSDQRSSANYHQPIHDQVLVTTVPKPEKPAGCPDLSVYEPTPAPPTAKSVDIEGERRQVAAAREYRTEVDGKSLRIVRGDLHRHTELSWDVGPGNDGSFLDFYRYMIDVASMDFGGLTDHQGGGHYAYHWWLTQKSADMFYLPPRFVPLYGYERSAKFPDGHRNVFHAYRGVPVFAFQIKLDTTGVFPGVSTGDLMTNDTKLLYEFLRGTGGVSIPHTSATDTMGTDWRDNDPLVEPVVEIYQGARNSSEVVGGPRVHDLTKQKPEEAPGGYQAAGMVWNALAKGYRLGTTASSDHGSTHISYSLVYTPANDRQSIIDSIRSRHTYGATDNLIVETRANGHFMGDEFTTSERPSLELKVVGTDKISRIDLVHNNNYIYTTSPLKEAVDIKYVDREPKPGLNYYYFRIQQDNGEVAWASPVWINYTGK